MTHQIAFIIVLTVALGIFGYSVWRLAGFIRLLRPAPVINRIGERLVITLKVAFGQTKILRRPLIGFIHALVWWGFIVITIGSLEIVVDGIAGTERVFSCFGPVYTFIVTSGDVFGLIIALACLIFLWRRLVIRVKRFSGIEMGRHATVDASIALLLIFFLMITLLLMNTGYLLSRVDIVGYYPVSEYLIKPLFSGIDPTVAASIYHINWWGHIIGVMVFANVLPYSKHFHVFMSVPNVFLSKLGPMMKMSNMPDVTKEVKLMMNPDTAFTAPEEATEAPPRFGIKDIEDVSWNSYIDSLACTQCGRCTSSCPANLTGKRLSPRKIMVDVRRRMNDKGPKMVKDKSYDDGKALVGAEYITPEELWACTTCHACVQECPVCIDQVSLILDMRRYLVMEESSTPAPLTMMMNNIENNGAPWQYGMADRMNWAEDIKIKS